jgi:fructose-1,6-bisphosphatase/inositol monophosphatase family enzyme
MLTVPVKVHELGNPDLDAACRAVLEGAKIIRHAWEHPPSCFEEKSGHFDLVSEVDKAADEAIQAVLKNAFPDDFILSEELSPEISTDVKRGRVWVCDPLDGTACFLFKVDPYSPTVMLCLLLDGVPTVSVVVQPIVGVWTYAVLGKGAFRDSSPVYVTKPYGENLKQGWVEMNHYGDQTFESKWFQRIDKFLRGPSGARLVSRAPPHSGVALRLLKSAEIDSEHDRGLQMCVHDHNQVNPKQLPWDIVPIKLLIEEAGGVYIDSCKGLEEDLDPFNLSGPIIIGHRSTVKYLLGGV